MQEDLIREPVELIDEDLDVVAGGLIAFSLDINIADVSQYIKQIQISGYYNSQPAANVSSVTQVS